MILSYDDHVINKYSKQKITKFTKTVSMYDKLFELTNIADFLILKDVYSAMLSEYDTLTLAGVGTHVKFKLNSATNLPEVIWIQFYSRRYQQPNKIPFFSLLMCRDSKVVDETKNLKSRRDVIQQLKSGVGFKRFVLPLLGILFSKHLSKDVKMSIDNSSTKTLVKFKTNEYAYRVKTRAL